MASTVESEVQPIVGQIEEFLQSVIGGLEPERRGPAGRGRPRILPAMCLWAGMLVCVLRGFSSQLALWRLLTQQGLWDYPRFAVSDQAVYKRLADAGAQELQGLFEQISRVLAQRLESLGDTSVASFASAVVAIDETRLDQVARRLPGLRDIPRGDEELLAGKIAGVFDVRSQLWRRVEYIQSPRQNEKIPARALLDGLPPGTLILADLGYFGFEWFDDLTDAGYFWVSRMRSGTSYEVIHRYYKDGRTFDGVIWLGKHRADRAKHAVRLVRFMVGKQEYRYITNVLEPAVLPMIEMAKVYARRWDFEMAVRLLKRELGLHLLWSAKRQVVLGQVWAALTIAQVLSALRFEIASRADADIFEVSMALLIRYMPRFAAAGEDPVAVFVERGREAMFIRPSRRIRPRAPSPPHQLPPLPPDIALIRTPRYAHRKCAPRTIHN